jgi:hypothetical protein
MGGRLLVLSALIAISINVRAAESQTISGTLTDAVTGAPLGSASGAFFGVSLYDADGLTVATVPTAADGSYVAVVSPGAYYVQARTSGGYVPQLHSGLPCLAEDCVVTSGTPVTVISGTTVVNFALPPGGRATGTVRRADNQPLDRVPIRFYSASGSLIPIFATSALDGTYSVDGLAAGTYFARTEAVSGGFGSHSVIDELFGGTPCPSLALLSFFDCRVTDGAPILVTAGGVTSGIDFSLERGGVISGYVSDSTGQGINSVRVTVYAGDRVVGVDDAFAGEYIIGGLPPGTYAVEASRVSGDFRREWYDDKCVACGDRPTPVTVTAGSATTGINFTLAQGGAIEGTIRYAALDEFPTLLPPAIFVYDSAGTLVTSLTLPPGPGPAYSLPYRVGGLPSGTYYVKAWDSAAVAIISSPGVPRPPIPPAKGMLVGKLFHGVNCVAADCKPTSGTPVRVTAGSTTTGVDFALEVGATIAGVGIDERVEVFDARGVQLPQRSQYSPGNRVTGLPAGTYFLRQPRGFAAEVLYRGSACPLCPPTFGTPIVVAAGQHVTGIDFPAPGGRAIIGTVRDAVTLAPLSNVTIEAYAADGRLMGTATSSFGGRYRMGRLNAGTYYVRTVNGRNYADEVFDNVACSQCAATRGAPVAVDATADTTGIDFSLAPAATLGGAVTAADGFLLPGSRVSLFDGSGTLAARTTTSALGRFTTVLPSGSYRARTEALPGFVRELFDNIPCPQGTCDVTAGTAIALASLPVTNVNFLLAACVAPSIAPLRLATGAVGASYRQTFGAAGGTPPRRFQVASGTLPAGLALDGSTGVLAGTPTAPGSYAVTIGATDDTGCAGTRDYTIDIHPCAFKVWGGPTHLRARGEPGLLFVEDACGTWTATTDSAWIRIDTVSAAFVPFAALPNPGPDPRVGTVVVGPRVITVHQSAPVATPPFGFMDVPLEAAVVDGSVAVGGWALDDLGVLEVRIYRNSVSPEPPGERVFLGTAVFVEGARPDIETAYPTYPSVRRAGWGFMLLTNMLPQQGNGAFQISAYAVDADRTESFLGLRTIIVNNATAILPFGAIDTPRQGETIAGASYVNFGWALTPQPKSIPVDGSTFQVFVDGVSLGPVTYNLFRPDVAALFPGYANAGGAVGYRLLDTTALDEGLHTIAWTVVDSLGAAAGIGSRYFRVSNSAPGTAPSFASGVSAALRSRVAQPSRGVPARVEGIDVGRRSASLDLLPLDDGGRRALAMSSADRLELSLEREEGGCAATWSGYHVVAGETRALPAGSALDSRGTFYWQPGPAFVGTYNLVFVRTACDNERRRVSVTVAIRAPQ